MAVELTGQLLCRDAAGLAVVLRELPLHIALSRAEDGCERFEVSQSGADPLVWEVSERFVDAAAFERHQARGGASRWGKATADIPRAYHVRTVA